MPRHVREKILVLVGYSAVSTLYFGFRVLEHPGRAILGSGRDPQIFIWLFGWWAHAIGTGQNPFISHAIYAPDGVNLAWVTSIPGLAVPFAPVTWLFGPVVAYNLAALLMPALAAWTAYLLCRYLTQSLWPALVGGYLFGFSSYVVAEELGHPHMTAVFVLPLVVLALVRYIRSELTGRGLAWRLGLLLAWQLWISTEVFFTTTFAIALGIALAFVLVPASRSRLRIIFGPLGVAYAICAVLASPLIVYALIGFQSGSINDPALFSADLLNFVIPTHVLGITTHGLTNISNRFPGSDGEQGAYVGIPTLAVIAWYALRERRSAAARFLVASIVVAMILSLGTAVHVKGGVKFQLPWHWVAKLPFFDNVLPVRLAVFTSLAAAVAVALWAQSQRALYSFALPALAVLVLVPAFWRPDYRSLPERWPFFTDGTYKLCINRGENVAIFPFGFRGDSMLWQAETGFWFRLAGGYLLPKPPEPFIDDPVVRKLTFTYEDAGALQLLGFARRKHVDRVVAVSIYVHPGGAALKKFGTPQWVGGVIVSPACSYPPFRA